VTDYTNSFPSPATLLNDYFFQGQGFVQLSLVGGCQQNGTGCYLAFSSATYTFTPEPSTAVLSALALLVGGAWL
jgi:hypothetical protein